MHGLVSLLPPPYYQEVEGIWKVLEEGFGLRGIRITPYPHFSWQIAEDYDFARLEKVMRRMARSVKPFSVLTAGLAVFTGSKPVLYIPVVKSPVLISLHEQIWELCQSLSTGLSSDYSPSNWMPHISLAYNDLTKENIAGPIQHLAFRPLVWEMTIDNFALIYEPTGQTGTIKYHFNFT